MCLAIPGKITGIESALDDTFRVGKVSFGGVTKEVNLAMVPEANVGDCVMVHVGVAISLVDGGGSPAYLHYLARVGELNDSTK